MMEVYIAVMWPQVKKCEQPPELREARKSLPRILQKEPAWLTPEV